MAGELKLERFARLRKTDEISSVFRFRCRVRSDVMEIAIKPNATLFGRLAISVPKKVMPRSVDRNYAKRLLREIFRLHQKHFAGFDVVLRTLKPLQLSSWETKQQQVLSLFDKAKTRAKGQ